MDILRKIWADDAGQDLVEYALVAGLVALGAIAAVTKAGTALVGVWDNINTMLGKLPTGN